MNQNCDTIPETTSIPLVRSIRSPLPVAKYSTSTVSASLHIPSGLESSQTSLKSVFCIYTTSIKISNSWLFSSSRHDLKQLKVEIDNRQDCLIEFSISEPEKLRIKKDKMERDEKKGTWKQMDGRRAKLSRRIDP